MDKELMKKYLEQIWQPYVEKTANDLGLHDYNALLTLDSFKAHTTEEMREHGTTHCINPGGCTSKLQPLDVSINKPFRITSTDPAVVRSDAILQRVMEADPFADIELED